MDIGDKIKKLREEFNMSQEELAKKIGYTSRSSINKIEKDGRGIPSDKIVMLAKIFRVSPAYLMGWEDDTKEFKPIETITIPLYDCVACGEMTFLDDDIIDYIKLPTTILSPYKDYFCNYAKGDSMIDRGINDGDLLFFEKINYLDNGQIGLFCHNYESTCKVFRETSNGVILMPANNDYEPIFVDSEDFRIVGKLVYKLSKEN